jgi:hypothetical protein
MAWNDLESEGDLAERLATVPQFHPEDHWRFTDEIQNEATKETDMTITVHLRVGDVEISDDMLVNPDGFIPAGEYNPHNVRPWVIGHEHGAFAIAFASCEQDAIDEAIDAGKMDGMKVSDEDLATATDDEHEDYLRGGNASEYFYQDYLWMEPLDNPAFSFVALLREGAQA